MNKGCQLFRNCMSDATDDKSFGLVLTAINEAHKRIVYITCDRNIFSADCCVVWCMIFMLQVDARKVTKIGLESKQGKQDLNHKKMLVKDPFNRIWNNRTSKYTINFLVYDLIVYRMTGHPSI